MAIEVLKPGLSTAVQDLGRPGYYHLGLPLSGAMDRHSLRAANLLVGNDEGAAVLEAVFMGPELHFTEWPALSKQNSGVCSISQPETSIAATSGIGNPSHWPSRDANISLASTRLCCGLPKSLVT